MKKILTGIIALAALSAFNFATAQEVSVLPGGATASSGLPADGATLTMLGGNVVEYKEYSPTWSLDLLSVSATIGFESEYMFRAEKYAGPSIQPGLEFAYPIYGFDVYVGAWYSSPVQGNKYGDTTELDLYAGVTRKWGALTFDVGYIFYWYPEVGAGDEEISRDMEVYVGVTLDTSAYLGGININPSAYYFYNWILKQQVIEISLGYEAPVGEWVLGNEKLTLPITVYGGYLSSGSKYGDLTGYAEEGVTYMYYGASADLAYALTDFCTISAGIRYSQRGGGNEGEPVDHAMLLGRERNLWFGAKVSFGF